MVLLTVFVTTGMFAVEILLQNHTFLYLFTSALLLISPFAGVHPQVGAVVLIIIFQVSFWVMLLTKGSDQKKLRGKSLQVMAAVLTLCFFTVYLLGPYYEQHLYNLAFDLEEHIYHSVNGNWERANDEQLLEKIAQSDVGEQWGYRIRSMYNRMFFVMNSNTGDSEPLTLTIYHLDDTDENTYVPYFSQRKYGWNLSEGYPERRGGDTFQYFEQKDMEIDWNQVPETFEYYRDQYLELRNVYMREISTDYIQVPTETIPRLTSLVEQNPTETSVTSEVQEENKSGNPEINRDLDDSSRNRSGLIVIGSFFGILILISAGVYYRRVRHLKQLETMNCRMIFSKWISMLHFAGYCMEFDGSEEAFASACMDVISVITEKEIHMLQDIVSEAAYSAHHISTEKEHLVKGIYDRTAEYIGKNLKWDQKLIFYGWKNFH